MLATTVISRDGLRACDVKKRRAPPTFARTLAAARSRIEPRARRWVSAAAVAPIAAGIALAIWLVRPPGPSDRESTMDVAAIAFDETSIGTWGGPTDELLDVPGMDLLGDVPALGQDEVSRASALSASRARFPTT